MTTASYSDPIEVVDLAAPTMSPPPHTGSGVAPAIVGPHARRARPHTWTEQSKSIVIGMILPTIIVCVGFAVVVLWKILMATPPTKSDAVMVPTVDVVTTKVHTGGVVIRTDGLVVPIRDVAVPSQVAGKIIEKSDACRPGYHVNAGDVLFKIEERDFELEQERAESELKSAISSIGELDAEIQSTQSLRSLGQQQVELTLSDFKRREQAGIFVAGEMDKSYQNILTAKNSLAQVDQKLATMKEHAGQLAQTRDMAASRVETAKLNRSRTTITAPISGTVIESPIESNTYVSPGQSLAVIQDTSSMEVRCKLRLKEMFWIWQQVPGQSPDVVQTVAEGGAAAATSTDLATLAAQPNVDLRLPPTPVTVVHDLLGKKYIWKGTLSRYDGSGLDPQTRQVPCLIDIPNPRDVLTDGPNGDLIPAVGGPPSLLRNMYVTVRVMAKPPLNMVALPETAVQPGSRVWRVREPSAEERAEREKVETAEAAAKTQPDAVAVKVDDETAKTRAATAVAEAKLVRKVLETLSVEVLQSDGGMALIQTAQADQEGKAGLKPGDQIVISPIVNPIDGMWVKLAPEEQTADVERKLAEASTQPINVTNEGEARVEPKPPAVTEPPAASVTPAPKSPAPAASEPLPAPNEQLPAPTEAPGT